MISYRVGGAEGAKGADTEIETKRMRGKVWSSWSVKSLRIERGILGTHTTKAREGGVNLRVERTPIGSNGAFISSRSFV